MVLYEETLIRMTFHAVEPWDSVNASAVTDLRTVSTGVVYTDQRIIDICLNCPKAKCNNCMKYWGQLQEARPTEKKGKRGRKCTTTTKQGKRGSRTATSI